MSQNPAKRLTPFFSRGARALARDLTLVTRNTRHLQHVPGMKIENLLSKAAWIELPDFARHCYGLQLVWATR